MTTTELIFKHRHNLLALAKIRGAVGTAAKEWGIEIGTIASDGHIPLYLSEDLLETADFDFYSSRILTEAMVILKSNNPELF